MIDYDKASPEERKRLDIQAICKMHEQGCPPGLMRAELDRFMVSGDVEGAKRRALDILAKHSTPPVDLPLERGAFMTRSAEPGANEVGFCDIIKAQLPDYRNDAKVQKVMEIHEENVKLRPERSNRRGLIMPMGSLQTRDLATNVGTSGGYLVADNLQAGSFIDLLRNQTVTIPLGATTLSGLTGDVSIPKQTSGSTAYWVTEGEDLTESAQAFGQIRMTPHTVGAYVDLTRRMILQSSIDIESFVRQEIAKQLAVAIDLAALNGEGASGEPKGILQTSGIGTVSSGAVSLAKLVELHIDLAAENAYRGSLGYAIDPITGGKLMQEPYIDSTDSRMILNGMPVSGEAAPLLGHRALFTNQLTDRIIFGNWADLIIGFWSGLDVTVDRNTLSTSGGVRIVAFLDIDLAIRHAESFSTMEVTA